MKRRMNALSKTQLRDWEVQAAVNGRLDEWQAVALVEEIRELHSEIQQLQAGLATLRKLERAVRDAMRKLPLGRGWVWRGDATDIATLGRLLEGESHE